MAYNKKIALSKNVAAIELAFRIEAEKRKATPKEIQVLNQYSGFGGLKCVLYNANEEQDRNKMAKTEIDMFDLVKHLNEVIRVHTESATDYKLYMDSIRSSVQTAFYTPVFIPRAIGTVLNNVGVLPQKVLDPSAGSGVFGQTLSRIWPGVTVDCFEKDLITAKILAAANPDFKVKNTGFEKISVGKVDSYDLVTSNIPFGNFKVYDTLFRKSGDKAKLHSLQYIHDYFFLKAIDSLRPGGILAFVTSKGIADSPTNQIVRESMVKQCRLLSAVRFPNDLFMEGSGISVASDLILLQKRIPGTDASLSAEEFAFAKSEKGEEGVYVNSFFTEYPDNMLVDRVEIGRNQFGQLDYNYSFSEGQDILEEKLLEVLSDDVLRNFSEKDYRHMEEELEVPRQKEKPPVNKKEVVAGLSLFDLWDAQELEASVEKDELVPYHLSEESLHWHQEGMLGYDEGKVGIVTQIGTGPLFTPIDAGEPQLQLLKDYIGVRDAYGELYYAERDALKEFPELRDRFNRTYDLFRARHGALNEKQNQKVFMKDSFQMVMQSLELYENGQYIKGTLFHEPVAFKPEILPSELSPTEGLLDSYNRFGTVDIEHICLVTGLKSDEVIEALKGKICYDPRLKMWAPYEKYIAGQAFDKIEDCESLLSDMEDEQKRSWTQNTLELLKAALPPIKPFGEIDINMGERWIPLRFYERYAEDVFLTEVKVCYFRGNDRFAVSLLKESNSKIMDQWAIRGGTKRYDGLDLFIFAMEDRYPDVKRRVYDSNKREFIKVVDPELTQLMASKVSTLRENFVEWMQKLSVEDKQKLTNIYNRRFNGRIRPKFDGSHQIFPGIHLESFENVKELYPSQKDAIWMNLMLQGGIVDHSVGGGKTFIICISAHEMVRLGITRKPIIAGIKQNIGAIAETYARLYPQDKMLFIRTQDITPDKRAALFQKIKNNDWDVIIMSHENFGKIPQSLTVQTEIINSELQELIEAKKGGEDILGKRDLKNLERSIENKRVQIQNFLDDMNSHKATGTAIPDFDEMGIGHIFLDESHQFKNLGYGFTKHYRVSGLGDAVGSQRAKNLLLSLRTIQRRTGRDLGATFFSGTTISNSLTELYSIFKYLTPSLLEEQGIYCIDAFLANFAQKTSEFEVNITNEIVNKERYRYFIKVDILAMNYALITDFRVAESIGLERPTMEEKLCTSPPTPEQEAFAEVLKEFAKSGDFTEVEPYVNSTNDTAKMLIATDLERKLTLDMRILDPVKFHDHPTNKVSRCAADIADDYYKYSEYKGTQFVFTDLGSYRGDGSFSPVEELKRKLVEEYAIPEHEIRFIHEFNTETKKEVFCQMMNEGKIRIGIGGTNNLGTGTNAQERCVAINHLDIPWKPMEIEQRNGRGARPGNWVARMHCDNKIAIRYYCTEKTLDAYKYNLLKFKQGFIYQFKSCNLDTRKLDEGSLDQSTGMNYSEYCAELSGNTDLLDKIKVDKMIVRLQGERKAFYSDLDYSKFDYATTGRTIDSDKKILERINLDLALFTPEIKERLEGLKHFDTCSSNFKKSTLVRYEDYPGVSSSEKVGELIQLRKNKMFRFDSIDSERKIGVLGGFEVKLVAIAKRFEDSTIEMAVSGPGNINYKHNRGVIPTDKVLTALAAERALIIIPRMKEEYEIKIEKNQKRLDELAVTIQRSWGKEAELAELKTKRIELEKRITDNISPENKKSTEQVNNTSGMSDGEFAIYQQQMELQAALRLIGVTEEESHEVMQGKIVPLTDVTLVNPYVEGEQIECSSAKLSIIDGGIRIDGTLLKDFFDSYFNRDTGKVHTLGVNH